MAGGGYRYGFNGKENDNEVKGVGDQVDYGMRVYDPRNGRFLSVDPLQKSYPWWAPYHFAGNSPIVNVDLDGQETYNYILTINERTGKAGLLLQSVEHGSAADALTVQKVNYYGRIYTIDVEWNYKPYHGFATVNGLVGKTEAELDAYFVNRETDDQHDERIRKEDEDRYKQAGAIVFGARALDHIQTKEPLSSGGSKTSSPALATTEAQAAANSGRLTIPQGLTEGEFEAMSQKIVDKVGGMSQDIVVQGSRASGTAKTTSDIDIAIKMNTKDFSQFLANQFKNVNVQSSREKTFIRAVQSGKIQAGEAGLSGLRKELEKLLGKEVDISVIKEGGPFDNGAQIPITKPKTK